MLDKKETQDRVKRAYQALVNRFSESERRQDKFHRLPELAFKDINYSAGSVKFQEDSVIWRFKFKHYLLSSSGTIYRKTVKGVARILTGKELSKIDDELCYLNCALDTFKRESDAIEVEQTKEIGNET